MFMDSTVAARTCTVCGGPMRTTNKIAICWQNPECRSRNKREKLIHKHGPTLACSVCNGPIQRNNETGICVSNPQCRAAWERAYRKRQRRAFRPRTKDERLRVVLRARLRGVMPAKLLRGELSPNFMGGRYCYCCVCGCSLGWRGPAAMRRRKTGSFCCDHKMAWLKLNFRRNYDDRGNEIRRAV